LTIFLIVNFKYDLFFNSDGVNMRLAQKLANLDFDDLSVEAEIVLREEGYLSKKIKKLPQKWWGRGGDEKE